MARTVVNQKDSDALKNRFKDIYDNLYTNTRNTFEDEKPGEVSFSDFLNFFFYGIVPDGSLKSLNISEELEQKIKYAFSIKGSIKNILKLNKEISTVDIEENVNENNEKSYGFSVPFNLYLDDSTKIKTLDTFKLTNILNNTLSSFLKRRSGLNKSDIKKYGTANSFVDTIIKEYNKGLTAKEKIGSKSATISREVFAKEINKVVVDAIQDVNTKLQKEYNTAKSAYDEVRKIESAKRREERNAIKKATEEKEEAVSSVSKISCALFDANGRCIESIKGKTIEQIKEKYASKLNDTSRIIFTGVTNSTGTRVTPLTLQMVNLCPNADVVEVCEVVSQIEDYAFARKNIKTVILRGCENFNKTTGEFNWELKPNTLRNDNPDFRIVAGGRIGDKERYVSSKYNDFMYEYYNGLLEKSLNGQIYTQYPDSNIPKLTSGEDKKEVVGSEDLKNPDPQPQPQRSASTIKTLNKEKKNYMYPYQLDVHRHLNFGPGSLLRWSIKRPVWSTIAVTGAILGIAGIFSGVIPAFGALFASIKIAATSVFVGGLAIAGVIQIGKQILKKVNKRYRSLFMKDKANKINKKIAERLRQVQDNITLSKSLMEKEVGILEGNSIKENNPSLSVDNTYSINEAHKEYLQLIAKNKKLMKQVSSLQKKMNSQMTAATTLEHQIGGEGTQKCQDRERRLNEANSIIEYYKKASKSMGRLYKPEPDKEGRKDGESNLSIIDLYESEDGEGSASVGTNLNKERAKNISNIVKERIKKAISQETDTEEIESVDFEGKEDFYTPLKEAYEIAHPQRKKVKPAKKSVNNKEVKEKENVIEL